MKKIQFLSGCLLLLGIFFPFSIKSEEIQFTSKTLKIAQFQKVEWEIKLSDSFKNPYLEEDISLNAEIISPSGKNLALPCFYVSGESGNSVWNARFSPRETGLYKVKFVCRKGTTSTSSLQGSFNVQKSIRKGFLNKNDYWTFRCDNGDFFRGIGENICWESRSNDDSKYFKALHEDARFNYEFMLRKLAANGGNYTRIWMCPWNLPLEWKKVSPNTNRYQNSENYFNPAAIEKMDRLIELADSLGIYIMLTLDQAGNYMGDSWETNNYNIKNGGFAKDALEFFTNPKSKQQYKNRLRYLIARWGYSPAIGAWEFFNEVDYVSFDNDTSNHTKRKAVVVWHDEMSNYLKKNDPYSHLVTTSISHRDVDGLNILKNIDFNQKHVYKNTPGIPKIIDEYTQKYQKPYVIGEFGYEWDWSKNFNDFAADMDNDFKRGLWYGLFSPTPVLPMSWWWEFFENHGLMEYFSHVKVISDLMLKTGNGKFEKITVKTTEPKVISFAVKCGNTSFIYLYNPENSRITTDIDFSGSTTPFTLSKIYDCEKKGFGVINTLFQNKTEFPLKKFSLEAGQDLIFMIEKK